MSRKDHVKHLLPGAIGLIAALSLAACGSSGNSNKTTASHSAAAVTSTTTTTSSASTTTQSEASTTAARKGLSRAERQAILVMVSCARQHGINLPPQNLSGPNASFNSQGVNTSTPAYKGCLKTALSAYSAAAKSANHPTR